MSIQTLDEARRGYALALIRLAAKANAEASRMLEDLTPQPMTWLDDGYATARLARQGLHRATTLLGTDDGPMEGQTDLVADLAADCGVTTHALDEAAEPDLARRLGYRPASTEDPAWKGDRT